jgi:prevent-host-death family protein
VSPYSGEEFDYLTILFDHGKIIMMKEKSFSVSEFKARSLGLLARISRTGESLVITKRGKPIARVVPVQEERQKPVPGRLRDALLTEEDIVSPLGARLWRAAEEK